MLNAVKGRDFPRASLLPQLQMHYVSGSMSTRNRLCDGRRIAEGEVVFRRTSHLPESLILLLCLLDERLLAQSGLHFRSQRGIGFGIVLVLDSDVVLLLGKSGVDRKVPYEHTAKNAEWCYDPSVIHTQCRDFRWCFVWPKAGEALYSSGFMTFDISMFLSS